MYRVPSECPVCHAVPLVTRLECPSCGTAVEGQFEMGHLQQLLPEQLDFIEVLVRCEGKLSRVQEELGLSYPTVRNRLDEVIRALGYEVGEPASASTDEEHQQEVLQRLANREISSEEALSLLEDV